MFRRILKKQLFISGEPFENREFNGKLLSVHLQYDKKRSRYGADGYNGRRSAQGGEDTCSVLGGGTGVEGYTYTAAARVGNRYNFAMLRMRKNSGVELIELDDSCDPNTAEEFVVLLELRTKNCTIMCNLPYDEKTDPVLREFYDKVVDRCVSTQSIYCAKLIIC